MACPEVQGSSVCSETGKWALDGLRVLLPAPGVLSTGYLPGRGSPTPTEPVVQVVWQTKIGQFLPKQTLTTTFCPDFQQPILDPHSLFLAPTCSPLPDANLRNFPSWFSILPSWLILSHPHPHPVPSPKKLRVEPRPLGFKAQLCFLLAV